MQRKPRKTVGEIMITCIVWSLITSTTSHYAFGKDQDNCYILLNQEQAIQQNFISCPHSVLELLF